MQYFSMKLRASRYPKDFILQLAAQCDVTIEYCEIYLLNSVEYYDTRGTGSELAVAWFMAQLQNKE